MITQLFLDPIIKILYWLMDMLPTFDFAIPLDFEKTFIYVLDMAAWFVPLADIGLMLAIWLIVVNFNFIYALVMRVWDALPFT